MMLKKYVPGDPAQRADRDHARLGQVVADDAPVVGVLFAADEILADEAVDVAGDRRRIDAELLGERADGQAVFVAKGPEQAHLRDRQSVLGPALDAEGVDDADGVAVAPARRAAGAPCAAVVADAEGVGEFRRFDLLLLHHEILALS